MKYSDWSDVTMSPGPDDIEGDGDDDASMPSWREMVMGRRRQTKSKEVRRHMRELRRRYPSYRLGSKTFSYFSSTACSCACEVGLYSDGVSI